MKHLIKLNVEVAISCDEEFANRIHNDGVNLAEENIFPQLTKVITRFNIDDEELVDNMDVASLWRSRGFNNVSDKELTKEQDILI